MSREFLVRMKLDGSDPAGLSKCCERHVLAAMGDQAEAYAHAGKAAAIDPNNPSIERLRQAIAASRVDRR